MQILYAPNEDGDRPIIPQVFPISPSTSSVAVTVINKVTDSTVTLSSSAMTQSSVDTAVWFFDTALITGIDLETVDYAQLLIVMTATLSTAGTFKRYQTLVVNGSQKKAADGSGVWDAATASHTGSGTFGERVGKKLLDLAKFLGLQNP